MKTLVVIDMQNDFITGSLANDEAIKIIPNICDVIDSFHGKVYATLDTHDSNYLKTMEGKYLPVEHCIKYTDGWAIQSDILKHLFAKHAEFIEKPTFGSTELSRKLYGLVDNDGIYLVGTCTDICVISNALFIKTNYPNTKVVVISDCCAGVTPKLHEQALNVMRSCQIEIKTLEEIKYEL